MKAGTHHHNQSWRKQYTPALLVPMGEMRKAIPPGGRYKAAPCSLFVSHRQSHSCLQLSSRHANRSQVDSKPLHINRKSQIGHNDIQPSQAGCNHPEGGQRSTRLQARLHSRGCTDHLLNRYTRVVYRNMVPSSDTIPGGAEVYHFLYPRLLGQAHRKQSPLPSQPSMEVV
jgi:hypothetical protein